MSALSELFVVIEKNNKAIEDLKAASIAEAKSKLPVLFEEFFTSFPQVKTIYFAAYTPHWNDGEECTYRIYDVSFSPLDWRTIETPYFMDECFRCVADFDDGVPEDQMDFNYYKAEPPIELKAAMTEIDKLITSTLIDNMKDIVGDHVFVRIHRDGTEITEYEHD
jgi:hypothetical protein